MTTIVLTEVQAVVFEDIHGKGKLTHSDLPPTSAPTPLSFKLSGKTQASDMVQQVKPSLPSLAMELDPRSHPVKEIVD